MDESLFKKNSSSKSGITSCCKKCHNLAEVRADRSEYQKRYRAANASRLNEYLRNRYSAKHESYVEYRKANKEAIRAAQQERYCKNHEEILRRQRGYAKQSREGLADSYIRRVLIVGTSLSSSDVPQILVQLKRLEMLIKKTVEDEANEKC
ncbi:hypothetical protein JQF37_01820 [Pseudomonas sp. MIL9]|uniref:hypothetical protein n=1 Tax=Pseudomonas sp. MIL9 TaxID=2807620 RepID=UPI0019523E66|nr:hypothetical protein [Pseudomonas sp. MIL9]MBM6442365.1 hypothetical protein [Pseudomonas sp. MIL9]